MPDRPHIHVCPLPEPPVDEDAHCTACSECIFDAVGTTHDEGSIDRLSAAGRCGRWLVDRTGRAILASAALHLGTAEAGELELRVTDPDGHHIQTAVFRAPELVEERIRVDPDTGSWSGDALPVWKGEPVPLPVGEVTLEVSAPGFVNQSVTVKLRKRRKRRVTIELEPLRFDLDDEDDIRIVFGIGKPLD